MTRRRSVLVALLLGMVVLSACRADLVLDITVTDDGSGVVVFVIDADAVAVGAVPELAEGLRSEDLAAGGWEVDRIDLGGGVRYTLTKPFGSPAALPGVVSEIAGPGLLFPDSAIELVTEQDRREYRLSVTVDPTIEPADLSDDELTALLGSPLGGLSGELSSVDVDVTVRLSSPGSATPVERTFALGDPVDQVVATSAVIDDEAMALRDEAATLRRWATIAAAVIAVGLVIVAGLWVYSSLYRRRLREWDEQNSPGSLSVPHDRYEAPWEPQAYPPQPSWDPPPPRETPPAPPSVRPPARPPTRPAAPPDGGIDVDSGSWSPGESA